MDYVGEIGIKTRVKSSEEEVLGWVSVLPFSGTITKSQAKKMETPFCTTNCENCCNAAAMPYVSQMYFKLSDL